MGCQIVSGLDQGKEGGTGGVKLSKRMENDMLNVSCQLWIRSRVIQEMNSGHAC